MDINLDSKGHSLCFNREEFTEKDFSVDKFVSEYRKFTSLDVIQEDLNILYKKLCTAMVELINQDYADFVNLSTNLVGLDKSIRKLTTPLENLRTDVAQIHENLLVAMSTVDSISFEGGNIHSSKVWIQHMFFAFEGLAKIEELKRHANKKDNPETGPLETLERIAFVSNNVQFHVLKLNNISQPHFALNQAWISCCQTVKTVTENLEKELEGAFLKSLKNSNSTDLEKVLQIYSFISAEGVLERCFRVKIVRPFMKHVITESRIRKEGLTNVYDDILNFLPKYSAVLKITRNTNQDEDANSPEVDFLVNAVWPEIMSRFESISPVLLFSIGDPHSFHRNYSATIDFLEKFEHHCISQHSVFHLRNDSSYKEFLGKWNLTVYFEIRFQEIASKLEEKLSLPFVKSDGNLHFMLDASECLYTCLECCWIESIYLPCLKSSFSKLFLQLISRYNKHIESHLKLEENSIFIAMIINDMQLLVKDVKSLFKETVLPKFSESEKVCICAAFNDSITALEKNPQLAAELIVKQLSEKCTSHLKMIASIPQRYRKTNREVPSKPSPYVSQVLEPLNKFMSGSTFLSLKWKKFCQVEVVEDILRRCVISMRDVLQSIKKMEDSLKILKRAKAPSGQFSSGSISDDDKIRRQLALDVGSFEELISSLGLETSGLKTLKELKELVRSAERVPNL